MKLKAVKLALAIAILGAGGGAHAHGIAGNRYFPGTITFDDPAVADELILPAWSKSDQPGDDNHIVDRNASWAFMRLLTPTVAVGMDGGYTHRDWGGAQSSGKTQTHFTVKTELYRDDPQEALVSTSLAWGIGGSGAQQVGTNAPNTLAPGIFFGKGFGNMPDRLSWLRPFGVAGAAVVEVPLSGGATTNLTRDPLSGNMAPASTRQGTTLHWGFALEYSTLYLTDRFNGQPPKEEPLHQWVPLVEFAFDATRGHKTTGSINPGISYVAQTWQVAVEAVKPLSSQANRQVGVRAQLLFFLDDLVPSLFAKPVLSR